MAVKQPTKKISPSRKNNVGESSKHWLIPVGIVILTLIIYSPIFSADFLNWDDPTFVLGNKNITSFSFSNIRNMFTTFCMGNYCPVTQLSWAVDYQLGGGLHPKMFHVTSLLIHLINIFFVYILIYLLTNRQMMVAAITSLLFAIHPMHIESVAWIAERRDVLYSLFYLAGLLFYFSYLSNEEANRKGNSFFRLLRSSSYTLALLCFLGSLFSKGQAVTFPVVLLIVDYICKRKFTAKIFIEKTPFFILSLIFGYIAVVAQKTTPSLNVMHFSLFDSLFVGNYGLLLYLVKSIIPFKLSGYHPYPFKGAADIPMIMRVAPVIILALAALVVVKLKSNREIIGGLLFFLVTIFPVLQFLPVGETIISERYSYIPYIGLFFIIGTFSATPKSTLKSLLVATLAVMMIFITANRVSLWKNSIAFWTDAIEHYPDNKIPYNNRGYMYNEFSQFPQAIEDFNKGIALDSTYGRLYLNRGLSFQRQKMYDRAMADYGKAAVLDTTEAQTFMNRGGLYTDVFGKYDSGIADFERALKIRPDNVEAVDNMGVAYFKKNDFDKSIELYNKALQMHPGDGKVVYFRALAYAGKKEYARALSDAALSKQLGYNVDDNQIRQWEQLK